VRHRFETVAGAEGGLPGAGELPAATGPAGAGALAGGSSPPWELTGVTPPPGGEPAGIAGPASAREPAGLPPPPDAREQVPRARKPVPDAREQAPDAREPVPDAPGRAEDQPAGLVKAADQAAPDAARAGAPGPRELAGATGPSDPRSPGPALSDAGPAADAEFGREADDAGGAAARKLSPAGLRQLGVRRRPIGTAGAATSLVQRLRVTLGSYHIEVLLAEAPAGDRTGRSGKGRTWIASAPYLVWTPFPHDFPASGVAFACVGAGEEGCLFLDLAAAPGAITLGGDHAAATRLAESLAHQLCAGPAAGRVSVLIVGNALPPPPPLGAQWIASVADLPGRRPDPVGEAEIVFCRLDSNDDVFPLARYVAAAPHRVVPLVLADLPDAPWSFTAHPSPHLAPVLQPVVS
jgi:hypothetical protein